jgi:hypothetical protein
MPSAAFEPTISAARRSRPAPETARLLGLARRYSLNGILTQLQQVHPLSMFPIGKNNVSLCLNVMSKGVLR